MKRIVNRETPLITLKTIVFKVYILKKNSVYSLKISKLRFRKSKQTENKKYLNLYTVEKLLFFKNLKIYNFYGHSIFRNRKELKIVTYLKI